MNERTTPPTKPVTYALQFIGQADELDGGLRKWSRAPGCALVTSLGPDGPQARFEWSFEDEEALLISKLTFTGTDTFAEVGSIVFARGHTLDLRGSGQLAESPDPHLRHGTVVLQVAGGSGRFAGARGWVTSNLFLSDTGDVTESQLGVVFPNGAARAS